MLEQNEKKYFQHHHQQARPTEHTERGSNKRQAVTEREIPSNDVKINSKDKVHTSTKQNVCSFFFAYQNLIYFSA